MLSYTEENYIKSIYHLSDGGTQSVLTNEIAFALQTRAATVTDMLKKLAAKAYVKYEKYYGVTLTSKGKLSALSVIRKHRLWETFLVEKLAFQWDQVHEVAEQLEHIQSPLLIEKLDAYLGFPQSDPHGHPIPDKHGKIIKEKYTNLHQAALHKPLTMCAVRNGSTAFLQYLSKIGAEIGVTVTVKDRIAFDNSVEIKIDKQKAQIISKEAADNILVK